MKKILAILLSMCLLFCLLATNVVAAGENDLPAEENSVQQTEDIAAPVQLQEEAVTDAAPELLEAEPEAAHPHTADSHAQYAGKTWTALTSACFDPAYNYNTSNVESGFYYLTGDFTLPTVLDVRSGEDVVICLNGYNLTGASGNRMFRIASGAKVTVCDCGQGGKLLPQGNAAGLVAGLYSNAGGFYMNGGTIQGKTTFSNSLIYIGCATTVELTNATLTGNKSGNGGAITVASSGAVLNMTNTNITNCQATDGGAIYAATAGARINITGGSFSGNKASSEGGALYINSKPSDTTKDNIVITGTSFTANEANGGDNGGGAIFFREGKMTLDGVSLTGNKNKGRHGSAITYGVINSSIHSLLLKDCTITGNLNMSDDKRAAVAVAGNVPVTVSGNTIIKDNRNGTNAGWEGGTARDLFLRGNAKLTVDALGSGANIQVTTDYTVGEDPDDFLSYTAQTPVMLQEDAKRITHANVNKIVGYNTTDRFFYEVLSTHKHAACECAIEGATCDHTTAAASQTWTKWESGNSLPTSAGYYYLTKDVYLTGRQNIAGNVYICLNGFSIYRDANTANVAALIRVGDNSAVTIMNCLAKVTDGKLDAASTAGIKNGACTDAGTSGIWVNQNSALTLLGVEVSGNKCASTNSSGWSAGAILAVGANNTTTTINVNYSRFANNGATAQSGGAIVLRGGNAKIRNTDFDNNDAAVNAGAIQLTNGSPKLVLENCSFTGSNAAKGGVIYVVNGSVEASNVTFTQNTASGDGGVLYLGAGSATLTDCSFTKNTAKYGGAVYLPQGAAASTKLTMTDCIVNENTANGGCAAGLYLSAGETVLSGVQINKNTSNGNLGSAITIGAGANNAENPNRYTTKVTLHDCTVTGNDNSASDAKRGGVAVFCGDQTLTVSGKTVIDDNTNGGTECNIFLREATAKVTVGQLTDGAAFDVTTGDHNNGKTVEDPDDFLVKGVTGDWDPAWSKNYIIYTNNGMLVDYSAEENFYFYLYKGHMHCLCKDGENTQCDHSDIAWQPWESTDSLPSAAGNWFLTEDVTLETAATLNGATNVNLCLNGKTVTASSARDRSFYILNDDSVLTITDCGEGMFTGAAHGAFRLRNTAGGATMNIYGGKITENSREGSGGAIMMFGKGTLNMYGGEISKNKTTSAGGAITAENESEVNLYGGLICDNEAAGTGGGISLKGSQLNMLGGVIRDNVAAKEGGGVYAQLGSAVNLEDGEILSNEATEKGGGVFIIDSSTMALAGGLIKGNTSKTAGGVFIANNCEMIMGGGEIRGNEATENSGGMALYKAKVTITDGVIADNKAAVSGGGIRVQQDSTLILKGGCIEGNTASDLGGGIYAQLESTVEMSGGEIKNNKAGKGGGILIIDSSEMKLTGGLFSGNEATNNGGGVFIANKSKLTMTGGEIASNKAVSGGGMAFYLAEATISGCTVKNNYASENGGGILAQRGSTITLSGGTISGNSAPNAKNAAGKDAGLGGGMYVTGGSSWDEATNFTMTGNVKVQGNKAHKGAGILLQNFVTMDFKGGQVSDNTASNNGGGIFVANKTKMNMSGGTVSGNKAIQGGGVAAYEASIIMTGGEIRSNTASENGGGVLVQKKSSVTLAGGSIHSNSAVNPKNPRGGDAGMGGGMYVTGGKGWNEETKLYVKGGSVYNNKAHKGAGILLQNYASMTMTGGSIFKNTANNNGGGLFPANFSKATISGGKIYDNKAVSGAGMTLYKAELTMTGGTIENNVTTQHGAALLIQKDSQVTLKNVTIGKHSTPENGGAIHISGGADLTMEKVTISNMSAGVNGGALFASGDGTTVKMTDCVITKNDAVLGGGGVAVMAHAALETNNCKISENTSEDMGGGAYIRKAYLVMNGGEVCNNKATNSGGGLHIEGVDIVMNREVFVMNDGLVSGNSAALGGGVYLTRDTHSVFNGGTITDNTADLGGGIYSGNTSLAEIYNTEILDNEASVQGGGVYLKRGSRTTMEGALISGNEAKDGGGGIYVDDDVVMKDLCVKGNASDNGAGGVHIAAANYDGYSYVSSVIKMSGDMYIYENEGQFNDLYISEGSFVNLTAEGLGAKAKLGVQLQSGLLTNTLIGSYDYEGGELNYTVTAGDRSVTDPEVEDLPADEEPALGDEAPEEEVPAQESSNSLIIWIVAGVVLVMAVLILLVILLRKKKNKKESAA